MGADEDDQYHEAVVGYVSATNEALIVPGPVVPEVCYLLLEYLGAQAEMQFLRSLANQELLLEHFTIKDLGRAIEILEQYRDAEFGLVDATVMAMAERLRIEVLLTIDHRGFTSIAPDIAAPSVSCRISPRRARGNSAQERTGLVPGADTRFKRMS